MSQQLNSEVDDEKEVAMTSCNKKLKKIKKLYPNEYEKIMTEKMKELYSVKLEQEISNTMDNILNKIFELYTKLKKNKQTIVDSINKKPDKDIKDLIKSGNKKEIVMEEIEYNNKIYYRDQHGKVTDEKFNLVGTYSNEQNRIILFEELNNMDNDDNIYDQIKKLKI